MKAEATDNKSAEPKIQFWIGKIGMPCRISKLQVNKVKLAGMTQREAKAICLIWRLMKSVIRQCHFLAAPESSDLYGFGT